MLEAGALLALANPQHFALRSSDQEQPLLLQVLLDQQHHSLPLGQAAFFAPTQESLNLQAMVLQSQIEQLVAAGRTGLASSMKHSQPEVREKDGHQELRSRKVKGRRASPSPQRSPDLPRSGEADLALRQPSMKLAKVSTAQEATTGRLGTVTGRGLKRSSHPQYSDQSEQLGHTARQVNVPDNADDDDDTGKERLRAKNRDAQRRYRQKLKENIHSLEEQVVQQGEQIHILMKANRSMEQQNQALLKHLLAYEKELKKLGVEPETIPVSP